MLNKRRCNHHHCRRRRSIISISSNSWKWLCVQCIGHIIIILIAYKLHIRKRIWLSDMHCMCCTPLNACMTSSLILFFPFFFFFRLFSSFLFARRSHFPSCCNFPHFNCLLDVRAFYICTMFGVRCTYISRRRQHKRHGGRGADEFHFSQALCAFVSGACVWCRLQQYPGSLQVVDYIIIIIIFRVLFNAGKLCGRLQSART